MKDREAQDLVRMIESNWQMDLGPARGMWRAELLPHDAELATKAVTYLARKFSHKPRVSDLSQVLSMFARNAKVDARTERDAHALEQGKRGYATPEWVWVWMWARNDRDPQEWRGFPQQLGWANPDMIMNMSEYESLRDEWRSAGHPKGKRALPVLRAV